MQTVRYINKVKGGNTQADHFILPSRKLEDSQKNKQSHRLMSYTKLRSGSINKTVPWKVIEGSDVIALRLETSKLQWLVRACI